MAILRAKYPNTTPIPTLAPIRPGVAKLVPIILAACIKGFI